MLVSRKRCIQSTSSEGLEPAGVSQLWKGCFCFVLHHPNLSLLHSWFNAKSAWLPQPPHLGTPSVTRRLSGWTFLSSPTGQTLTAAAKPSELEGLHRATVVQDHGVKELGELQTSNREFTKGVTSAHSVMVATGDQKKKTGWVVVWFSSDFEQDQQKSLVPRLNCLGSQTGFGGWTPGRKMWI